MDIEKIKELIKEGNAVLNTCDYNDVYRFVDKSSFYKWQPKIIDYLRQNLPSDSIYLDNIEKVERYDYYDTILGISTLESLLESLKEGTIILESKSDIGSLENILYKFHKVVNKLSEEKNNINTVFNIENEHDVQHLLHGLLSIHFITVFRESPVPHSKGSSSRVDFFIKDISTIVEVKKTRKGLENRKLSEELSDDINKYQKFPDCNNIYFFIYDPDNYIKNPENFKTEFTKKENNITIKTIITPKI